MFHPDIHDWTGKVNRYDPFRFILILQEIVKIRNLLY